MIVENHVLAPLVEPFNYLMKFYIYDILLYVLGVLFCLSHVFVTRLLTSVLDNLHLNVFFRERMHIN